jgi:hypothetical protein
MSEIVDEINKRNAIRFGPRCEDCGNHQHYCRCYVSEYMKSDGYKHQGGLPMVVSERLRKEHEASNSN